VPFLTFRARDLGGSEAAITVDAQLAGAAPRFSETQRPYRDTSPWNTLIPADVYTIAVFGDNSGYMNNLRYENGLYVPGTPGKGKLVNDTESRINNFLTSDPAQYTMPLYYVSNATPLVTVTGTGVFGDAVDEDGPEVLDSGGYTVQVPVPVEAAPCAGADAQIVIVNLETGDEWMFGGFGGTYPNFTAGNGSKYNIGWLGVPPDGHPSIGAGIPSQIGLIRRWEIDQGFVGHALQIAGDYPCGTQIYPATKSDGGSGSCLTPGFLIGTNSDLSVGGALFNKYLAQGPGTADQTLQVTVGFGKTLDGFGFTSGTFFTAHRTGAVGPDLALAPWSGELPGDGWYTLDLYVDSGDSSMQFSYAVAKCDSTGAVLVESGFTAEQALTTGQKRLQLNVTTFGNILGTDATAQDRIRVRFRFRSTAGSGNSLVTLRTGTVRSMLTCPFAGWVPEGARLRLDPAITDAEIAAYLDPLTSNPITAAGITLAKCLRDYGAYWIDQSGNKKIRAECTTTQDWTGVLDNNTLRPVPCDKLRWVESPSHTLAPWFVPDRTV
jgi:hypothetical protein